MRDVAVASCLLRLTECIQQAGRQAGSRKFHRILFLKFVVTYNFSGQSEDTFGLVFTHQCCHVIVRQILGLRLPPHLQCPYTVLSYCMIYIHHISNALRPTLPLANQYLRSVENIIRILFGLLIVTLHYTVHRLVIIPL